jgi:hypothetical protein
VPARQQQRCQQQVQYRWLHCSKVADVLAGRHCVCDGADHYRSASCWLHARQPAQHGLLQLTWHTPTSSRPPTRNQHARSAHLADAHEALQHADGGARLAALLCAPLRLVVRQQHLQRISATYSSCRSESHCCGIQTRLIRQQPQTAHHGGRAADADAPDLAGETGMRLVTCSASLLMVRLGLCALAQATYERSSSTLQPCSERTNGCCACKDQAAASA